MADTTATVTFRCGPGFGPRALQWGSNGVPASARLRALFPGPHVPVLNGQRWNPAWYRYFDELNRYLDGLKGPTISELNSGIQTVQTQAVQTATVATVAINQANAAATSINTTKTVLVNDGVTNASTIPTVPVYNGILP